MSLDIGVGDGSSPVPIRGEPSLCLEDDALYWFLHPLFEQLQAETGQYIDLYGNASFANDKLDALKRMLAQARTQAESQPDTWEVHVGTQLLPVRREVWNSLTRETLLELIARWERVVARAEELRRPVVCFGD